MGGSRTDKGKRLALDKTCKTFFLGPHTVSRLIQQEKISAPKGVTEAVGSGCK